MNAMPTLSMVINLRMAASLRAGEHDRQEREAGFSLVELMVAMGILVAMVVIAVGSFKQLRESTRVDAAAEEVVSIMQQARLRALARRVNQQVVVDYVNQEITDIAGVTHSFQDVTFSDYSCTACNTGGNNGSTETLTFTARGTMSSVAGGGGSAGQISILVNSARTNEQFIVMINNVGSRIDVRRTCSAGACS